MEETLAGKIGQREGKPKQTLLLQALLSSLLVSRVSGT